MTPAPVHTVPPIVVLDDGILLARRLEGEGARVVDIEARAALRDADAIWQRQSGHGMARAA